jgi:pSer/pThr/pTyr-binding forkhead associated (FHA) protein
MAITVVVRSASGGESPSLTFDGDRVVIGRSDGCDVRLPDPSVSLRHASIRATETGRPGFVLVDEGSTNGTWVGGVKLSPHTPRLLRSGDLVRVGRVWLEIATGQHPVTPDLGLATRDLALALVRRAMDAVGDDTRARVRVTEGPDLGAELAIAEDDKPYLIGRAAHCALPLADEDASREHASLTRRGGQVLLRDLSSRNGVLLGDVRISPDRDVGWRPPTMVRIGASVLSLHEPVGLALLELESSPDERLADEDAPPAPPVNVNVSVPESVSESAPAPAAPIATVSRTATTVPRAPARGRRGHRAWGAADIALAVVAIAVIGVSLAGLVWVLR